MKPQPIERLVIRSWPKLVFIWPIAVFSLLTCGVQWYWQGPVSARAGLNPIPAATAVAAASSGAAATSGEATAAGTVATAPVAAEPALQEHKLERFMGGLFLALLGLNLTIITFDFPRTTWIAILALVVAGILGVLLLNQYFHIIPPLVSFVQGLDIRATTQFYLGFSLTMVALFAAMIASSRFDYWELTANELVHHTGLLGDIERYSTAGLKLNKEITDIFEYILAGSGTIILNIPGNPRPIVLHNVLRIGYIEQRSDMILNARFVRLDREGEREEVERAAREDEEN